MFEMLQFYFQVFRYSSRKGEKELSCTSMELFYSTFSDFYFVFLCRTKKDGQRLARGLLNEELELSLGV